MIQKINIYADFKSNYFIKQLFSDFDLIYKDLDSLSDIRDPENLGVIFYKNKIKNLTLEKINSDHLCLTNDNISNLPNNKNITYLKTPTSVVKIQNYIKKLLLNKKIQFGDIEIVDKKITNNSKNISYYLTDIECKILIYLIKYKNCKKNDIKNNILKIKSSIETNSIDSHLTRIRKKLEKIETKLKIKSKNDFLSISIN